MPAFSSADPSAFVGLSLKQAALGTPNLSAPGFRYAKYLSGLNFDVQQDVTFIREGGDGLDWGSGYLKTFKGVGQVVVNLRPEIAGQIFALMPGGATWNGGTVPASHLFHTGHASFPYCTIVAQHPSSDMAHLLSDVRFTGLTLEAMTGEPLKLTLPFTAITYGGSIAANLLVPTYGVATGVDSYFKYYDNPTYILDGSQDTTIESWKIDLALGAEELQAQRTQLDDIVMQNRDANIEIVRRYQNSTTWRKIAYGGGVSPTTSVATGSFDAWVSQDSGNNLRQFHVFAPLIAYNDDTLTELDPDGKTIRETITGKILKGATNAVNIMVNNGHASTY
jgi:hypothetical protein